MALALNRTGVVFKKCDRGGHKPDSNEVRAAGTCQHTCSDVECCPHAWTCAPVLPSRSGMTVDPASPDPASPERAYLQLAAILREKIRQG